MGKRILSLLIAVTLFLTSVMTDSLTVNAAEQQNPVVKSEIKGTVSNNLNKQSYERWASTVKSYLVGNADGTMTRVEYAGTHVAVEIYSAGGELLSRRDIEPELPLFGGFYAGENENFLVFGQINADENDEKEVIRVVKYTKDWERAGAAGLYGANTVKPFDGGSLRMAQDGDILYVRTSHKMYKWIDDVNHQANLMFSVKIPTMEIADECSEILNSDFGYISHSFNQFIEVNGSELIAVDHGDANPRSVVLTKYNKTDAQEVFTGNLGNCTVVNAFNIKGQRGDNSTGVSVGGFEYSDTSYLIAGNSVLQDESYNPYLNRNIFISSIPIDNFKEPQIHWITNHNKNVSNPQMVKIDGNRLLLLWTEDNVLHYVFLNAEGEPDSEVYSSEVGALSDCKPVLIGQNVVWYCTSKDVPLFYAININSPDTVDILNRSHIVKYELMGGSMAESSEKAVNYGSVYGTLPEPVKEGFLFLGWYTDAENGNIVTEGTTVTAAGNEKLYARWLEKQPCGKNLSWNIEDGVLTISGTGEMYDLEYNAQPWYKCKHLFQKIVIENGVENIGNYAFSNFANITDVVVADSVSSIGTSVFTNCKSLRNLKLPKSAKTIGNHVFYNCTGLKSVVIPDGVRNISDQMFCGCSSLTEVTIPESVEYILSNAFNGCSSLSSVNIPKGLISIGPRSFYNCSSLKSIELGEKAFTIGSSAFEGCTGLEEVTIPLTVTNIGDKAFSGNDGRLVINGCRKTAAHEYAIQNNIQFNIISYTFSGKCGDNLNWNLTDGTLTISGTGEMPDWYWYREIPWDGYQRLIESVIVEDGITTVASYAFYGCFNLKDIKIPEGITYIGMNSFQNCKNLSSIELPDSIDRIGDYAFYNCSSLVNIEIPYSVTSVRPSVFENCSALEGIVIPVTVTDISATSFSGHSDSLVIYGGKDSAAEEYAIKNNITFSTVSYETDGTYGENLRWHLKDGILTISGTGEMPDGKKYSDVPWFPYHSLISKVVVEGSITKIGSYAFYGSRKLTDIILPDSLMNIGKCAFSDCSGLKNITIPDSVKDIGTYAFYGCSSLGSINLPEGLTRIEDFTFYGCSALNSINIPNNAVYLGNYAFYKCTKLKGIEIPEGIMDISSNAFYGCTGLETVKIHRNIRSIEDTAFSGHSDNLVIYGYKNTIAETYAVKNSITFVSLTSGDKDKCGENLKWNLTDGILTISGVGEMTDWISDSTVPWYSYREQIVEAVVENGVTGIGRYAFAGCGNLMIINLPDSITGIGEYAFSNCSGLMEIEIPSNITCIKSHTFAGCSSLKNIGFNDRIESVREYAFADCAGLKEVKLTNRVMDIGAYAFAGCSSLTYITIPDSVISIDNTSFSNHREDLAVYGYENTTAETYAKNNNITFIKLSVEIAGICGENLTWKLDNEEGILTISGTGEMADWKNVFSVPWNSHLSMVKEVVIEDGVTSIGRYAFRASSYLTKVTIPDSMKYIDDYAFDGCKNLTDIKIPFGVRRIGKYAFYGCKSLNSVVLFEGITKIEPYTFSYCSNLSSIKLPEGLTTIGEYAFFNCTNLGSIEFPDSMKLIGQVAFYGCNSLNKIVIPEGVKSIDAYTFTNCSNLEEITVPKTVTYIEDSFLVSCKRNMVIYGYKGTMAEEYAKKRYINFIDISSGFSGNCSEKLAWNLENGILTVTGTGEMPNWSYDNAPWYRKRDSICEVIIGEGVTGIGKFAFNDCANIEKITLPITLTSIDDTSFSGCSSDMTVLGYKNTYTDEYAKEKGLFFIPISYEFSGIYGEGIEWSLKNGKLTVSGQGKMEDIGVAANIPWNSYKLLINEIEVTEGIERIAFNVFSGCRYLNKVKIADSVTEIGTHVFSGCKSLKNITLPKGIVQISDRLFCGCDSLTEIDIPEGVTKIGMEAFSGCSSLTDLKIPESVKSISYEAFSGCSNITFMEIPDSVEYIGKRVFLNCRELREVTLPDNLREISDEMFTGCANLTNIAIPDSVKIMGKSIFKNCTGLRSIVIPNQVEIIESNIFYGCVSLKSVLVPTSVILIDDAAFSGCSDSMVIHCYKNTAAEEYVTKNDMVSEVHSYEYSGKCTEDIMWHLKDGILTISSAGEVSGQDDWSYEDSWKPYNNGIVQIVIKEGVSRIGNSAFSKFSRLCNVEIPNGITTIGYNAFYGCSSLTAIRIPDSVIEIGSSAFYDCTGLKEVKFLGDKPRFLIREVFGNVTADGYYPANSESWDGITENFCGGTFKWSTFYLAEGTCGEGLSWNLDGAGTLTLNGIGQMESFEAADNVPWHSYKDKIKNIVISDGIISIGDYAFYGMTGLEKIVIPSAVSSIGAYAFGNCAKLTEIIFHGSMPDFKTGVFEGVTAQVYYPADDSSWKNTENNPAGGNLTWNNHVHIEIQDSERPATCTETGLTAGSHCSVCDKIINAQQEIPALGHIEMESAGKKPTCTEKGITSGVYCLRCHIYLKESESIEALGHSWDEGTVKEHATCMQTGTMLYVCTVCGKYRTQELEISSHALDYCPPIAATCTMPGQIEHWNCRVCGKDFVDAQASAELENLISVALGHKWQEGTVTKEATCTEKGIEVYICSLCGESMEMELEMTPHILDYCPPKAGTCITPGIAEHWNCRICKKDFGDAQAVTEPDSLIVNGTHKWNGWKRTAKATVFSAEKQKRTCSLCNISEERKFGKALKPYITLTANSLKMQIKQSTSKFKVTGMAAGDYVVSVKSGNTKILKVSNVKKNGTFKLTAQKKTGTVKLTITLASGLKKTIKVNIGKGKVHTTKITIASKKVSLKKGRKMTLKPIVYPVTSQQKVTYKSTNRKIADVNSKGIITAKKKGTAKITVSSGSKKLTVTVKVTK